MISAKEEELTLGRIVVIVLLLIEVVFVVYNCYIWYTTGNSILSDNTGMYLVLALWFTVLVSIDY